MKRFILLIPLLLGPVSLKAAEYKTANFTVTCSDSELAQKVGDTAEFFRKEHAREWLGEEFPKWNAPCPITVKHGQYASGGNTAFSFDKGEVFGWRMMIQGTPERLLDCVVPHEVLHTVFACHFRRPLPRWADEGAAIYTECEAEKKSYRDTGIRVAGTSEQIPLKDLLSAYEYPDDTHKTFVLYAQSIVLAEYLLELKGKPEFVAFLETYFKSTDWDLAFRRHYQQSPEVAYTGSVQAHRMPTDSLEVKLLVSSPCIYCDKAKAETVPVLKKRGVKVSYQTRTDIPTPVFVLIRNGKEVGRLAGFRKPAAVMAEFAKSAPKTVQVAQGVGIGYFGPLPGSQPANRSNPHADFSAQQRQLLNQIIDQRSQLAIDGTISTRLDDLKGLMKSEIQAFVLEAQSKLTDEQKALINATDEQKSIIAGFKGQIEAVEAGKAEFIQRHQDALAEQQRQTEALAAEVKAATEAATAAQSENTSLKDRIKELAKGTISAGLVTALQWATVTVPAGGVLGYGLKILGAILANRRKETEEANAAFQDASKGAKS